MKKKALVIAIIAVAVVAVALLSGNGSTGDVPRDVWDNADWVESQISTTSATYSGSGDLFFDTLEELERRGWALIDLQHEVGGSVDKYHANIYNTGLRQPLTAKEAADSFEEVNEGSGRIMYLDDEFVQEVADELVSRGWTNSSGLMTSDGRSYKFYMINMVKN